MAITAQELRRFVEYNPETGELISLVKRTKAFIGKKLGTVCKYNGYVTLWVGGDLYPAHRLIWLYMTGEWPKADTDHINGDRADNRWCNLREATRTQNICNSRVRRDSIVGLKGVRHDTRRKKNPYSAALKHGDKRYNLGSYPTAELAHAAYCAAAEKYHGEFARGA